MFKYQGIYRIYNDELFATIEKNDDTYRLCFISDQKSYYKYVFRMVDGVLVTETDKAYVVISLNELVTQSLSIKAYDKKSDKTLDSLYLYKVYDKDIINSIKEIL